MAAAEAAVEEGATGEDAGEVGPHPDGGTAGEEDGFGWRG